MLEVSQKICGRSYGGWVLDEDFCALASHWFSPTRAFCNHGPSCNIITLTRSFHFTLTGGGAIFLPVKLPFKCPAAQGRIPEETSVCFVAFPAFGAPEAQTKSEVSKKHFAILF